MKLIKYISGYILVVVLFTLCQKNVFAQSVLFDHSDFFNLVFDQKDKVNQYYIGNNPAFLDQEISDERLLIETSYTNDYGDFKQFYAPKDIGKYKLSFTGKKRVSDNILFKGSAGIQKEIRNNWDWFTNKDYERTRLFLYGDSTSGTTRYNSILLNAQYNTKISDKFSIGFSLDYAVDEGLKEVSPKPESVHRDLMLNIGLGYLLTKNTSIGVTFKYSDFTEKIRYSEDVGAIYDETIILKFTGYDNPLVYSKKTEKRNLYNNVYTAAASIAHNSDNLNFAASFSSGFDNQTIKDDNYTQVGFSRGTYYLGNIKILLNALKPLFIAFQYNYNSNSIWAKHPKYNVLLAEEDNPNHVINLGFEFLFNNFMSAAFEAGIRIHKTDISDYFNNIYANSKGNEYLLKLGIANNWSSVLATTLGVKLNINDLSDRDLEHTNSGEYFNNFRKYDLLYILTPYTSYGGYLKTSLLLKNVGEFTLNLYYSYTNPKDEIIFENSFQKNINAFLQFRKLIY